MPLKTERLYLDIDARSDVRLARSLNDPTNIDPGPLWVEGEKLKTELYLVEVRGQEVAPIAIPADYTCTLSAKRLDAANETEIFSVELTRSSTKQNGHTAFTGTIDLTGAPVAATLLIDDEQLTDGVRLRVQVHIADNENPTLEELRPSFVAILRANIDDA